MPDPFAKADDMVAALHTAAERHHVATSIHQVLVSAADLIVAMKKAHEKPRKKK